MFNWGDSDPEIFMWYDYRVTTDGIDSCGILSNRNELSVGGCTTSDSNIGFICQTRCVGKRDWHYNGDGFGYQQPAIDFTGAEILTKYGQIFQAQIECMKLFDGCTGINGSPDDDNYGLPSYTLHRGNWKPIDAVFFRRDQTSVQNLTP